MSEDVKQVNYKRLSLLFENGRDIARVACLRKGTKIDIPGIEKPERCANVLDDALMTGVLLGAMEELSHMITLEGLSRLVDGIQSEIDRRA